MSKASEKTDKGESRSRFRLCVPPCPRYITSGDTHSLCVVCLGAKHAESALEGARSAVSSAQGAGSALLLSSSEEVDVESVEYLPLQSPQYEELLEVVTRAVAKLNIDWPAEKQAEPQKSKLDERFLHTKPLPPRRSLPFFLISTPRCRDHGRNLSRPAYSSPPLIIMAMWRGWVTAVTERCPGLSRRLRAICPPAWHRLWRLRSCPPSRCAQHQHWWARGTWQQVRLVRVCTRCQYYRRIKPTC